MDFSKHNFEIEEFGDFTHYSLFLMEDGKKCIQLSVNLLVGRGHTSVTGDFGSWIFDREIHPANGFKVSRSYMDTKLSFKHKYEDYNQDKAELWVKKKFHEHREKEEYQNSTNEDLFEELKSREEDILMETEWEQVLANNINSDIYRHEDKEDEAVFDCEDLHYPDWYDRDQQLEVVYEAIEAMGDKSSITVS